MPTLKIDLTTSEYEKLAKIAADERRPTPWQAEYLLKRAISRRSPKAGTPEPEPELVPAK